MRFSRWIPVLLLLVLPLAGWGDDYVDDVYFWTSPLSYTATHAVTPSSTSTSSSSLSSSTSPSSLKDTIWSQPSDTVVRMIIRSKK